MSQVFGMDEEMEEKKGPELVNGPDAPAEKKKAAFAYWHVGEKSYRMKLNTEQTCKLEDKYRRNLMDLLLQSGGTLPPLGIMLTVIQSAIAPWEHGIKFKDIQRAFDAYVEEGGTQLTLFSDVIMQVLMVSGFFTENQKEDMTDKLEEVKESL